MSGFFKHFIRGMKNSIIVDVPDFETNNQYIDMINIGNDLRTSMGRLSNGESRGAELTGIAIAAGVSYIVYVFKTKKPEPPKVTQNHNGGGRVTTE